MPRCNKTEYVIAVIQQNKESLENPEVHLMVHISDGC